MDVYYNGNGNTWGRGRAENKLTEIPIQKSFLWEKQEIFVPALYTGRQGVILDVCAKIPVQDMLLFLKKWTKDRRLSLKTQEDYEQMEAENPSCMNFTVKIRLNDNPLISRMGSSIMWYPETVFQAADANDLAPAAHDTGAPDSDVLYEEKLPAAESLQNDKHAEKLMEAYRLDRECAWFLGRFVFNWNGEPILSPKDIALSFHANPVSVTTAHFTTDADFVSREMKIVHPATGQEYLLTLHEYERNKVDMTDIGAKGLHYPEYCYVLSYSVSPQLARDLLDIRDCAECDQPRKEAIPDKKNKAACGATAFFVAGKSPVPDRRCACSSLHFEPVSEVRWRVVFQVQRRVNAKVRFSL